MRTDRLITAIVLSMLALPAVATDPPAAQVAPAPAPAPRTPRPEVVRELRAGWSTSILAARNRDGAPLFQPVSAGQRVLRGVGRRELEEILRTGLWLPRGTWMPEFQISNGPHGLEENAELFANHPAHGRPTLPREFIPVFYGTDKSPPIAEAAGFAGNRGMHVILSYRVGLNEALINPRNVSPDHDDTPEPEAFLRMVDTRRDAARLEVLVAGPGTAALGQAFEDFLARTPTGRPTLLDLRSPELREKSLDAALAAGRLRDVMQVAVATATAYPELVEALGRRAATGGPELSAALRAAVLDTIRSSLNPSDKTLFFAEFVRGLLGAGPFPPPRATLESIVNLVHQIDAASEALFAPSDDAYTRGGTNKKAVLARLRGTIAGYFADHLDALPANLFAEGHTRHANALREAVAENPAEFAEGALAAAGPRRASVARLLAEHPMPTDTTKKLLELFDGKRSPELLPLRRAYAATRARELADEGAALIDQGHYVEREFIERLRRNIAALRNFLSGEPTLEIAALSHGLRDADLAVASFDRPTAQPPAPAPAPARRTGVIAGCLRGIASVLGR